MIFPILRLLAHGIDFPKLVFASALVFVAAASLSTASRGGASPQNFEKRALTIFRREPGPYESAHQLNCSLLFPTAMAKGIESTQPNSLLAKSNKKQTSAAIDRQHRFWKYCTIETTKRVAKLPRQTINKHNRGYLQ